MSHILGRSLPRLKGLILQKNTTVFSALKPTYCLAADDKNTFVTPKSNPDQHGLKDVGLFYKIDNELIWDSLYKPMVKLDAPFYEECKTFNGTYIMIRKPAIEVINYLKNANYSNPINKYVLYGKNGNGVSTTLLHILHYAYLANWLIVHVPSITSWLVKKTERVPSTSMPGHIDLPTLASAWLMHFKTQNLNVLQQLDLKLENSYVWNVQEENKKGDSFISLIDHGISRAKYSCDVIRALLEEVKGFSRSGKVKTLVAIEQYSIIFHPRRRSKTKIKYLDPKSLSFMESFKNMAKPDWHNGAAVLACFSDWQLPSDTDHLPLTKLTEEGFEFLDPFVPIEVPKLTKEEMVSLLSLYKSWNWIPDNGVDRELKLLCAGNIKALKQLCAHL